MFAAPDVIAVALEDVMVARASEKVGPLMIGQLLTVLLFGDFGEVESLLPIFPVEQLYGNADSHTPSISAR